MLSIRDGDLHDGNEGVGGGLGSNSDSREVSLQKISNESGFSGRVLSHEHDHGFGLKVWVIQSRGVEVMEVVGGLQGEEFVLVNGSQSRGHRVKHFRRLFLALITLQPGEHGGRRRVVWLSTTHTSLFWFS